jgi:hypothetical protein
MTNHLPQGIGVLLRSFRLQGHLSLREVEERSLRFAQERGSQSYQVSATRFAIFGGLSPAGGGVKSWRTAGD